MDLEYKHRQHADRRRPTLIEPRDRTIPRSRLPRSLSRLPILEF